MVNCTNNYVSDLLVFAKFIYYWTFISGFKNLHNSSFFLILVNYFPFDV